MAAATGLGLRFSATTWASDAACPPGGGAFARTRDADTVLARIEDLIALCGRDTTGRVRCRPSIAYVTNMSDELARGYAELVARPCATHAACGCIPGHGRVPRAAIRRAQFVITTELPGR